MGNNEVVTALDQAGNRCGRRSQGGGLAALRFSRVVANTTAQLGVGGDRPKRVLPIMSRSRLRGSLRALRRRLDDRL
jgi:hypothetical protein